MTDTTNEHGPDVDKLSGVETTGHEWDGLKELNNPLPRWWLIVLYATIVWGVIYIILMPSLPFIGGDHTRGIMGNSQREEALQAFDAMAAIRREAAAGLIEASVTDIAENPVLLEFALVAGASAFGDNCAPCHGSAALGGPGYPNLQDDAWLWGGDVESIHETLLYGINTDHDFTRIGQMPAFGRDGILSSSEIRAVSEYVRSLGGLEVADASLLPEGTTLFEENCASCHGDEGKGMIEVGAPNLTDTAWLYGFDLDTIIKTIANGRAGVMPGWEGRLDPETIKSLAVHVHSLGGGA